jgi:hemerythrin-like metal-binding protein
MALIVWDDSIKVGLWTIDTQHERWVNLINDLHEAMLAGQGKTVLNQTLATMLDYTRTHFADEEDLMSKHGYAAYAAHKALHDAFAARVLDLQQQSLAGKIGITRDVMNHLRDWLVNHIQIADVRFVPFLKSKGVL